MWIGFSIAALISIVNLINSIYPIIPYIPVKRQGIGGGIRVSFYPFVIGMSFMMPKDLLFSCWVFFWLYKIELMVVDMMGWQNLPRFPYAAEQGFGVYMGLLIFALWIGKSHFIGLVRHLFTSSKSRFQLEDSREADGPALAFMAGGFGVTALLMFLRTRFLWWPLHPLGYVTADSWGMFNLWSCIFVAWVIKTIILRYGGLGSYRRAVPFFLGVALGDYIVGFIWSILSILTDTPLYSFFS